MLIHEDYPQDQERVSLARHESSYLVKIIYKIERRNDKDFLEGLSKIHRMLKNVDRNHILGDLREDRDQR